MTPPTEPKPTIEELDGILTLARGSWLTAGTPAAKKKARRQIDDLLDLRIALMDDRDLAPVTELQLH